MDNNKNELAWIKANRQDVITGGFVMLILLCLVPLALVTAQTLSAAGTWIYAVTAFFTLLILVGAGLVAVEQLAELTKSRTAILMLEIYKAYKTKEMNAAIRSVMQLPIEPVGEETEEHLQRREVSDFWNWLAGWLKRGYSACPHLKEISRCAPHLRKTQTIGSKVAVGYKEKVL